VLTSIDIRLATAARSHHGSPSKLLLLCSRQSDALSALWLRTITALQQHKQQNQLQQLLPTEQLAGFKRPAQSCMYSLSMDPHVAATVHHQGPCIMLTWIFMVEKK
jgi:hypothetical protein